MNRILLLLALGSVLAAPAAGRAGEASAPPVRDIRGRTVSPAATFRRIVSLYSAHTENLFALGLDEAVLGVSRSETYPPAALQKPVFDPRADAETFLAAGPDLVLVRPMLERAYPVLMERLEHAGVTVVSLQPRTGDDLFAYWRTLGRLTGRRREAEALIRRFEDRLDRVRARLAALGDAPRRRVYFESIHRKMKTFAPTSIAMTVLREAGGINVAADAEAAHGSNIANYGKERILRHAREIDAFLAQRGAMNDVTRRAIETEPGFAAIPAVRDGTILIVEEEIVSRPTPRLAEGIETISRFLYPHLWKADAEKGDARHAEQ